MYLSRIIVFVLTLSCCSINTLAQNRENTLEARISFMEEIFTSYKHKDATPQKCFALSFVNNSGQDIFIPYFFNFILNKVNQGTFLSYYRKDESGYQLMLRPTNVHGVLGVGMGPYPYKGKLEYDKFVQFVKENNKAIGAEKVNDLLAVPSDRALFLKAHEEKQYYVLLAIHDFSYLPGDYKITFEPLFNMPKVDEFPWFILTYKKFFPTQIKSNIIYLHFETLVREDR
ncbi:hypothetical protein ABIB50_001060 [Mucilaginibacter sp. UYCu711]